MPKTNNTKIIRSQPEREENRRLFRALQEKGLSPRVVPDGTKACHSHNWQVPDAQQATATLDAWAHQAGDAGIALLLGAPISDGSHLGVIDVDHDDYTRVVACLLGNPAVAKIGKKGASFFVRVFGTPGGSLTRNPEFRNRAIVNGIETDKVKVVECLFDGKISVLPPSVHPETGKPYTWTGPTIEEAELLQLPAVSFEHDGPGLSLHLLRAVVTNKHFLQLSRGVSTHDAARDFSAAVVAFEPSDVRIEDVVKAVLPEGYSGNTLGELPGLIRGAREKGMDKRNGSNCKKRKKSQADEVVELVLASGVKFFHWNKTGAFVELPTGDGGSVNYKLTSEESEDFIRDLYFEAYESGISDRAMQDALATIRGYARRKGQAIKPSLRVGGDESRVFHDLGRPDGFIVEIDREGYRLTKEPEARLIRAAGMRELPLPAPGQEPNSGLAKFFKLFNVAEEHQPLLAGYLISALHPTGPYCVLAVDGDTGAGKSFLCEFMKAILDPHEVMRLAMPDSAQSMMVSCSNQCLLNFDNISRVNIEMSNVLCTVATGSGFQTRKLYTDDQVMMFAVARPMIANGIGDFFRRTDLLDRTIPIQLERQRDKKFMRERVLRKEFGALLPELLHDLYTAVARAIRDLDETEPVTDSRMADAAHWVTCAESVFPWPQGTFVKMMLELQAAAKATVVDNSLVTQRLLVVLRGKTKEKPWKSTINALLSALRSKWDDEVHSFPKTPSILSGILKDDREALRLRGIHVEIGKRSNRGQPVVAWLDETAIADPFENDPKVIF